MLSKADTVLRTKDIAFQLGLDESVIGPNLKYLSGLNLVEYFSTNPEGSDRYLLLQNARRENVQQVARLPRLTTEVANLLFEFGEVDSGFLAGKLKNNYPKTSVTSIRRSITSVLSGLALQGICQRETHKDRAIKSQAKITNNGKIVVSVIIKPVRQALSGDDDLLAQWKQILWQNYAKETLSKHQEFSGHANSRSQEERLSEVYAFISQNPGVRPKEIQTAFGRKMNTHIAILLEEGKIRKEKQGISVRYYPQEITN